jgi:hypothetical protein
MSPTALNPNARLDPPRQAPTTGAEHPCPQAERLTRQAEPGNSALKSGAEPRNPFYHPRISMITTPIPHTNVKNGQPPLDNTRPFMDDTGRLWRRSTSPAPGRSALRLTIASAQFRALRRTPIRAPGASAAHRYGPRLARRFASLPFGEMRDATHPREEPCVRARAGTRRRYFGPLLSAYRCRWSMWLGPCGRHSRRQSSCSWSAVRLARVGPRDVAKPTGVWILAEDQA